MAKDRDRAALEALFVEEPLLRELERESARFNLFQVTNIGRRELVHSDCLGYFLDPFANHGFGSTVLDSFVSVVARNSLIDALDFHLASKNDVQVLREWKSIDLLIKFPSERIAIAIENKIDSEEHSNQLQRYRESLSTITGWTVLSYFLTLDGDPATCDGWDSLSYRQVLHALKESHASLQSTRGESSPLSFLAQYIDNLERFVMPKTRIDDLCLRLYAKHKPAIDLLIKHIPDARRIARDELIELLSKNEQLQIHAQSTSRVEFIPTDWNQIPGITEVVEGKTRRIMYFYAEFRADRADLHLYLGPANKQEARNIFYQAAVTSKLTKVPQSEKWTRLWTKRLADFSQDDVAQQVETAWSEFLSELPTIRKAFASLPRGRSTSK
jgi:hypothetical protein